MKKARIIKYGFIGILIAYMFILGFDWYQSPKAIEELSLQYGLSLGELTLFYGKELNYLPFCERNVVYNFHGSMEENNQTWYVRLRISNKGPLSENDKRLRKGIIDKQKIVTESGEIFLYIKEHNGVENMYDPCVFGECKCEKCWILLDVWPMTEENLNEEISNEECIDMINYILKRLGLGKKK